MQYDRLGFPIPREFETPTDPGPSGGTDLDAPGSGRPPAAARRARGAGPLKRVFVLVALGLVVAPTLIGPLVVPAVREAVVQWSVERAVGREARGDAAAAATDVARAIDWLGPDADGRCRLLCWRAMLLLEDRQAPAAVAEAGRAATLVPTATQPRRVRALAHVVAGDAAAALADAEAAVQLAGGDNPEALNHRAYIRALVGRDLEAALADVEMALAGGSAEAPEFLDTRGYILHLLGRHREAIDDLNRAIAATQRSRRDLQARAGRGDRNFVAAGLRSLDHALAVMHQHRGLACRAIGLDRQAAQDLEQARRNGFDPSRGVL